MSVRIIKASKASEHSAGEAFNFLDLRRQGDELILAAQRAADDILLQARTEATAIRDAAHATGREEGQREAETKLTQQAKSIADEQVALQLETALPSLRAAAASLQSERDLWLLRWERTAVRLGVVIAEKLLQRQLSIRPDYASSMINDALRLAAGQEKLTVYLHPEDLAAWGEQAPRIVESLTACADATLVADPLGSRGDCRIETRHGEIDARLETMLRRITEELIED